jgi:hypothetical protein
MSVREVRSVPERLLERGHGLLMASKVSKSAADVVPGVGSVRLEHKRSGGDGNGRRETAETPLDVTQVRPNRRKRGIYGRGTSIG